MMLVQESLNIFINSYAIMSIIFIVIQICSMLSDSVKLWVCIKFHCFRSPAVYNYLLKNGVPLPSSQVHLRYVDPKLRLKQCRGVNCEMFEFMYETAEGMSLSESGRDGGLIWNEMAIQVYLYAHSVFHVFVSFPPSVTPFCLNHWVCWGSMTLPNSRHMYSSLYLLETPILDFPAAITPRLQLQLWICMKKCEKLWINYTNGVLCTLFGI